MATRDCITPERLRQYLHYDQDSGVFVWIKKKKHVIVGSVAGRRSLGYIVIKIDQQEYQAHRLAWLYVTGAWPSHQIDHKDRNRANNAWINLRQATNKQNHENLGIVASNRSGIRGVRWESARGKWFAFITHNHKMKNLGRFDDVEDAKAARVSAERALYTHSDVCVD